MNSFTWTSLGAATVGTIVDGGVNVENRHHRRRLSALELLNDGLVAPLAITVALRRALITGVPPAEATPLEQARWRYVAGQVGGASPARRIVVDDAVVIVDDDGVQAFGCDDSWDTLAFRGLGAATLPRALVEELRQEALSRCPTDVDRSLLCPRIDGDAVTIGTTDIPSSDRAGVFCKVTRSHVEIGGYDGRDGGSQGWSFERAWLEPEGISRFTPDYAVLLPFLRTSLAPGVRPN